MSVEDFELNIIQPIVSIINEMARDKNFTPIILEVCGLDDYFLNSDYYFEELLSDYYPRSNVDNFGGGRIIINYDDVWYVIIMVEWQKFKITPFSYFDATIHYMNSLI